MKTCTKCQTSKNPKTDFHKDKSTKDGLRYWCKACARPAAVSYARRNPEEKTHRHRDYKRDNPEHYLLWQAKHRAKRNGLVFELVPGDIQIPPTCPVLKIPIYPGKRNSPNSPSLDRRDNDEGYTKANTQVISYRANVLKRDATVTELKLFADWIVGTYGT
jgi:hypothetical protein